jgi:ParB family transcriptional regulator, chromosome partitioning protein
MSDVSPNDLRERIENAAYAKLPVAKIRPNPFQPRRFFEQDALRGLGESIKQMGLLEDVLVRPAGDGYELVLGERRLRATQIADLPTISTKIVELSDDEMKRIAIVENVQRENLTPVEEAFAYKQYVDSGLRQKDVGIVMGGMQDRVADRLKVLSSHYYVQFQEERIRELEDKVRGYEDRNRRPRFEACIAEEAMLAELIEDGFEVLHQLQDGRIVLRRERA